jgi:hypothetical protein
VQSAALGASRSDRASLFVVHADVHRSEHGESGGKEHVAADDDPAERRSNVEFDRRLPASVAFESSAPVRLHDDSRLSGIVAA